MENTAEASLLKHWQTALGTEANTAWGCTCLQEIIAAYQEPQRFYHTLDHLQAVLDQTARADLWQFKNLSAVKLALFYHDAVYDPTRNDNEARSAALFQRHWQERLPHHQVEKVSSWILATASHQDPSGDLDLQQLLDIDLLILSAAPDIYQNYAKQVRQEYAHIGEMPYRIGRSHILKCFLDKPTIYQSQPQHRMLQVVEAQARSNLAWEIQQLNCPPK